MSENTIPAALARSAELFADGPALSFYDGEPMMR